MAVEYLGNGNDDGVNFGRSGDKIGFFGLTAPIVKPTITLLASSASAADNVIDIAAIKACLVSLGLCA
jgi:hypothetical protein